MPELLLELFCEEIPARMQGQAAADLQRLVTEGLKEAGLEFSDAKSFATPRRLALVVDGLPRKSPPVREERKGPRVGAPDKAVEGFLRSAGLKTIDEAQVVTDAKKGDYYVAVTEAPGRATPDAIAELVPKVVRRFPWPKAQRWGAGSLRWVRPLHSILCVFAGKTVPFEVDGIASGKATRGHRFMGAKSFSVRGFEDYAKKLREHYVILDAKEREQVILKEAKKAAAKKNLELIEDDALLAENAGLVEWPVVLMGAFDAAFLDLPPEVIVTAIRKHQKCLSVRQPHASRRGSAAPQHEARKDAPHPEEARRVVSKDTPHPEEDRRSVSKDEGRVTNRFILIANLKAQDSGKAIVAGNERVIRARLSDAMFFWDQDRTVNLEDRLPALEGMIFHEKLGTQAERVERLKRLARELAPAVGADPDKAERAAELCKADLVTEMVGEFPDLQGIMGRYYALAQGEDEAVADAVAQHYRPQGLNDAVPSDPVAVAVALADKLDMLVGFWAIDEKPTGSKDPYALRRAALGVIRIVRRNRLKLFPRGVFESHIKRFSPQKTDAEIAPIADDFQNFFEERLQVQLREDGIRYDYVDAVLRLRSSMTDLLSTVQRAEALNSFLSTADGENLLMGVKRAENIVEIEEKKDSEFYDAAPNPNLFAQEEEKALAKAIGEAEEAAEQAVEKEDFEAAMRAIARLRGPVDAFFDNVVVNVESGENAKGLRENRLKLLNRIRAATLAVADFSRIAG